MSLSGDAQISIDLLKQGYKQLANNIGNLQMRVLKMIAKNLDGKVPTNANLQQKDKALLEGIANTFERIYKYGEPSLELVNELSGEILKAGDAVNAYFAAETPWTLAKDESQRERYEAIIYTTLDALRLIAVALYPFMPETAEKILVHTPASDEIQSGFWIANGGDRIYNKGRVHSSSLYGHKSSKK